MKINFDNATAALQIKESLMKIQKEAPHLLSPVLSTTLQFMIDNEEYLSNITVDISDDIIKDGFRLQFNIETAKKMLNYFNTVWKTMVSILHETNKLTLDDVRYNEFYSFFGSLKRIVKNSKWETELIAVDCTRDEK